MALPLPEDMNTPVLYLDLRNVNLKTKSAIKEQTLKKIVAAINALMNSDGGRVELQMNPGNYDQIIRIIEQLCVSIMGVQVTVLNLKMKTVQDKVVCEVKKADSFITIHYNVYLPTETQVVAISSLDSIKDTLLSRKSVQEPVQLGSHCKRFERYQSCGISENKVVQLKFLKDSPSKRTKLVKRIKNNKFVAYISAFGNYRGGHIYIGIKDDSVVVGEFIPNEDISNITKEIKKTIDKMIWPKQIGQPKQGKHWEIFFEPVLDRNSNPIPLTFVIVIYIASCLGGLFTEVPECYEMVERKVERMSFASWKRKTLGSHDVLTNDLECCGTEDGKVENSIATLRKKSEAAFIFQEQTPRALGSVIIWNSTGTRQVCIRAFCILTVYLNNADWNGFLEQSRILEDKHPEIIEIKLVVLLKKIVARCRKHEFNNANRLMQEYEDLLPTCKEKRIFELLGLYVKAVLSRSSGNLNSNTRDLLVNALSKAEWVLPGLVTAIINIFAGTITDRFNDEFQSNCLCAPDVLSVNALQHLQQFVDCPITRADLEHKAHIILVTFYLGCNLSGQMVTNHVDETRLKHAESSVEAVERSITTGNTLTRYRESQFKLVQSILQFRYSESGSSERLHLKKAFELSKRAEILARECKYNEVVSWSKSLQALYTEKLLRLH